MAGMMGTNTSPSVLMACLYQGALLAAACLTSAVVAASMPAAATNSS